MNDYIIIPLTLGQETIISIEDSDLLQYKWHARKDRTCDRYYAVRNRPKDHDGKRGIIRLHRIILERVLGRELLTHEIADHIDTYNYLDNRRSNLRLADSFGNARNAKIRKDNTSGYKGISWDKDCKKWFAYIYVNRKTISLGYHILLSDAIEVRKQAVIKYHGEFGRLE